MASAGRSLSVTELEKRLKNRRPGRSPSHLAHLDIGTFPSVAPASMQKIAKRRSDERFHFLKWLYRSNNSDIALVTLQHDANEKVLKIHKHRETFEDEMTAYCRLQSSSAQATGAVLKCYGWSSVTPTSFFPCDPPTCSGDEHGDNRAEGGFERDASLPVKVEPSSGAKPTYSWNEPAAKQMMKQGADFRPPLDYNSWNWVMDNSIFGKEGQWLPTGKNLEHERRALLLEYLPGARNLHIQDTTRELALQALAGAQTIQRTLIRHGDYSRRNLLAMQKGRVVWVDFDRAIVLDRIDEDDLLWFKRELINVHELLFAKFYEVFVLRHPHTFLWDADQA